MGRIPKELEVDNSGSTISVFDSFQLNVLWILSSTIMDRNSDQNIRCDTSTVWKSEPSRDCVAEVGRQRRIVMINCNYHGITIKNPPLTRRHLFHISEISQNY